MARPVRLVGDAPSALLQDVADRAAAAAYAGPDGSVDLGTALALARDLGDRVGDGPGERWDVLATLGAADLTVARTVEPHLDALAILAEAGMRETGATGTWGVYAAEGPRRLHAEPSGDGWSLSGEKPWCSLADVVDHALLTAWVGEERGLFAVRLDDRGVSALEGPTWVARGLPQVRSTGLELRAVPARAVGALGWYLERPGFWHGGIGVAAVWFGATVALARRLRDAATRREPDQVALVHLGRVDAALTAARAVVREAAGHAAAQPGAGVPDGTPDGALVALRARQAVADAAEQVQLLVGRALGPGPLALEEEHARRAADLQLYVRQHHGERDLARQGEHVLAAPAW